MSKKDERRFAAQMHIADMERRFRRDTSDSVATARLYNPGKASSLPVPAPRYGKTKIEVAGTDTVSAVLDAPPSGIVAVLDFASYRNAGGGYDNGAMAQEEAMCAESNLFNILDRMRSRFYEPNRKTINDNLYTDKALYLKSVAFERDPRCAFADVIVCAAPNAGAAKEKGRALSECEEAMRERCRAVLNVAAANNVDHLVLGAYGCGVFKNDPHFVANCFKEWLEEHPGCFEKVVFAILKGGENLGAFQEVFED